MLTYSTGTHSLCSLVVVVVRRISVRRVKARRGVRRGRKFPSTSLSFGLVTGTVVVFSILT